MARQDAGGTLLSGYGLFPSKHAWAPYHSLWGGRNSGPFQTRCPVSAL